MRGMLKEFIYKLPSSTRISNIPQRRSRAVCRSGRPSRRGLALFSPHGSGVRRAEENYQGGQPRRAGAESTPTKSHVINRQSFHGAGSADQSAWVTLSSETTSVSSPRPRPRSLPRLARRSLGGPVQHQERGRAHSPSPRELRFQRGLHPGLAFPRHHDDERLKVIHVECSAMWRFTREHKVGRSSGEIPAIGRSSASGCGRATPRLRVEVKERVVVIAFKGLQED